MGLKAGGLCQPQQVWDTGWESRTQTAAWLPQARCHHPFPQPAPPQSLLCPDAWRTVGAQKYWL